MGDGCSLTRPKVSRLRPDQDNMTLRPRRDFCSCCHDKTNTRHESFKIRQRRDIMTLTQDQGKTSNTVHIM